MLSFGSAVSAWVLSRWWKEQGFASKWYQAQLLALLCVVHLRLLLNLHGLRGVVCKLGDVILDGG